MSSTLLWNLFPVAMNRALELHDQCLREQIKLQRGYELFTEGDAFFVAFRHAHRALAFCLSVQRRLNELPWDQELCEHMAGMGDAATFRGHGLRVRMGVHSGVAESVMHNPATNRVTYKGDVLDVASAISDACAGGQVVMSMDTNVQLLSMEDEAAEREAYIIVHMGQHHLQLQRARVRDDDTAQAQLSRGVQLRGGDFFSSVAYTQKFDLVEVVPPFRLTHKFPPLNTLHQLTPSAYDAPVSPLTIAFTYIDGATDINSFDPLMYFEAVELHNHCLRLTLAQFQGYEIREQDGQFLLAFQSVHSALHWAVASQQALLSLDWDKQLLLHSAAREEHESGGALIFAGLRVQMGLVAGEILEQRTCQRTGRREYFGPLLNKVARVARAAHGGQVLTNEHTFNCYQQELEDQSVTTDDLIAESLGHYAFKGQLEPEHVFLVGNGGVCSMRTFPRLKTRKFSVEVQQQDSFVVWEEYKQANLVAVGSDQSGSGDELLNHMGWGRYLDDGDDEDELRRASLPHHPQHSHLDPRSEAELRRRSDIGAVAGATRALTSQTPLSHHHSSSGGTARSTDCDEEMRGTQARGSTELSNVHKEDDGDDHDTNNRMVNNPLRTLRGISVQYLALFEEHLLSSRKGKLPDPINLARSEPSFSAPSCSPAINRKGPRPRRYTAPKPALRRELFDVISDRIPTGRRSNPFASKSYSCLVSLHSSCEETSPLQPSMMPAAKLEPISSMQERQTDDQGDAQYFLQLDPEEKYPSDSEQGKAVCRQSGALSRNNSAPMLAASRAERCQSEGISPAEPEMSMQEADPDPTLNSEGSASVRDMQQSASCSWMSQDDQHSIHSSQVARCRTAIMSANTDHAGCSRDPEAVLRSESSEKAQLHGPPCMTALSSSLFDIPHSMPANSPSEAHARIQHLSPTRSPETPDETTCARTLTSSPTLVSSFDEEGLQTGACPVEESPIVKDACAETPAGASTECTPIQGTVAVTCSDQVEQQDPPPSHETNNPMLSGLEETLLVASPSGQPPSLVTDSPIRWNDEPGPRQEGRQAISRGPLVPSLGHRDARRCSIALSASSKSRTELRELPRASLDSTRRHTVHSSDSAPQLRVKARVSISLADGARKPVRNLERACASADNSFTDIESTSSSSTGFRSHWDGELHRLSTASGPGSQPSSPLAPAVDARPIKILVCEDNAIQLNVLCATLRSLAPGCEIVSVTDGAEAIDAIMVGEFQVVLLDVHAGSVDGLTVSRSVTSRLLHHLCPFIILMSSDPLACQQDTASYHGAHEFLLKPLKRATLENCLYKVKNRTYVASTPREMSAVREHLRLSKALGTAEASRRFATMTVVVSPVPLQSALREALASQAERHHSTLQYAATTKELLPCDADAALVFLNSSGLSQQGIVDELKQIQELLGDLHWCVVVLGGKYMRMSEWKILETNQANYFSLLPGTSSEVRTWAKMTYNIGREFLEHKWTQYELAIMFQCVESCQSIVEVVDTNGLVQYVNPSFCTATGYTREGMIGRNVAELMSPSTPSATVSEMQAALRRDLEWKGVLVGKRNNQYEFYQDIVVCPVRQPETGKVKNRVRASRDLTSEKGLQNKFLRKSSLSGINLEDLRVSESRGISLVNSAVASLGNHDIEAADSILWVEQETQRTNPQIVAPHFQSRRSSQFSRADGPTHKQTGPEDDRLGSIESLAVRRVSDLSSASSQSQDLCTVISPRASFSPGLGHKPLV